MMYTHNNCTMHTQVAINIIYTAAQQSPCRPASFQKPVSKLDQLVMVGCWPSLCAIIAVALVVLVSICSLLGVAPESIPTNVFRCLVKQVSPGHSSSSAKDKLNPTGLLERVGNSRPAQCKRFVLHNKTRAVTRKDTKHFGGESRFCSWFTWLVWCVGRAYRSQGCFAMSTDVRRIFVCQ